MPKPRSSTPRIKWETARLYYTLGGIPSAAGGGDDIIPEGGVVFFSHGDQDLKINQMWLAIRSLGDDGWELVSAQAVPPLRTIIGWSYELYFKRPRAT